MIQARRQHESHPNACLIWSALVGLYNLKSDFSMAPGILHGVATNLFAIYVIWDVRTPPEKPVICCKKMCINNFKANESRMKHLQDT
jgi:hypothetical protein